MALAIPAPEPAVFSLHLRIDVTQSGDWQISLGHRDSRPEGGVLDIFQAARLQQGIQDATDLSEIDPLLSLDSDLDQAAAERRIGQTLSGVLNANPRLTGLFAYYLGQADQADQELVLSVDVSDARLRALPWELIARDSTSSPLERARITVARLGHGRPTPDRAPSAMLQTLVWCPQPDEPISASLLQTLSEQTAAHHLPAPEPVGAAQLDPDAAVVLHLVCHGRRHQDQLALLIDDGARDVDGPLEQLAPILPRVDLAVLSICESAAALSSELDSLVARLIDSGVRAVVAPSGALAVEAARAFLDGLYAAIVSGTSLIGAVGAGRRSVRALSLPYPDARWPRVQLTLASLSPVGSLLTRIWRPAGWPRPDGAAGRLLQQARDLAEPSGFVGIEHLLIALGELPTGPGFGLRLSHLCRAQRSRIEQRLTRWSIGPGIPDWSGTPRLVRMAADLKDGFTTDELWEALLVHGQPLIEYLLSRTVSRNQGREFDTVTRTMEYGSDPGRVLGLEVFGGPEDGIRFTPRARERLGRWSKPARSEHTLYTNTLLWDRRLSRSHLEWCGGGHVRMLAAGQHIQPGAQPQRVEQAQLSVGDLLRLGEATLLRAIGEAAP